MEKGPIGSFSHYIQRKIMIKIERLNKIYKARRMHNHHALKDINLLLPNDGLVFVLGKSGSGKSTLLNLIGGLDSITSGKITVDGNDISSLTSSGYADYRNTYIGFIFQDYHLIEELTVYENIKLSLDLRNDKGKKQISDALKKVGLAGYESRFPAELSGGERQRVAIARAIVKNPKVILADEPTGNLDNKTASSIIELLKKLSEDCLIITVSHNTSDAYAYADRIIELADGRIIGDYTRNSHYIDNLSLHNKELIYPEDHKLSDDEIHFINQNLALRRFKKVIKRRDKFQKTDKISVEERQTPIEKKRLSLYNTLGLSLSFLKSKALRIMASALMVSIIMVILSLAQTMISFDSNRIIAEEMGKNQQTSLLFNKVLDKETRSLLDRDYRVEINGSDIQKFYDAGYDGKIYPVYNLTVIISMRIASYGHAHSMIWPNGFLTESLGTMVVDEEFLIKKYGEIKYIARAEEQKSCGIIITDYIADSVLINQVDGMNYKTYNDIVGNFYYSGWTVPQLYINGIIDTGYKDRYKEVFELMGTDRDFKISSYSNNPDVANFLTEIYTSLGLSYSLNPEIFENYENQFDDREKTYKLWPFKLMLNDTIQFPFKIDEYPYLIGDLEYGLSSNEIAISYITYNEIFGTEYTKDTLDEFVPHTVKIDQYRGYDVENENPLLSEEVTIAKLMDRDFGTYCIFVSGDLYEKFEKNNFFVYSLYFDGTEGISTVLDLANEMNYEHQSVAVAGIHTMTKAVDVFVPIFELINIVMCFGIVFIFVSFSTKMIRDKLHDIGILKALGMKNGTVSFIFGLQIMLIAILTCVLSTIGYYHFIDLANNVLFESMKKLAVNHVVLDLDFLAFDKTIAIQDCILVVILAMISLIVPMLAISKIHPVKIIKSKE